MFGNNVQSLFEDQPINYLRSAGKQNTHKAYTVESLRGQMHRIATNLAYFIFAGTRLREAELSFTVPDNDNYSTHCLKILCDGSFKEVYKISDFNLGI